MTEVTDVPPLEVIDAGLGDAVLEATHGLLHLLLDLVGADDVKGLQEVMRHGDEGVLGPAAEPVHRAARDQTRELQGSVPELLSNLQWTTEILSSTYCDYNYRPNSIYSSLEMTAKSFSWLIGFTETEYKYKNSVCTLSVYWLHW